MREVLLHVHPQLSLLFVRKELVALGEPHQNCRMAKRPYRGKLAPAKPPSTAEEGAAFLRAHALKLFDQQDGNGANWPLMAASLFKAAFDALDRLPDDACRKLAGRVHIGAYDRVAVGPKADSAASNHGLDGGASPSSNTTDLKSNWPVMAKGPFSSS